MTRLSAFPLAVVLAAVPGGSPAVAQQPQQNALARYAFVPVEDGAMRLDTATGEVSLCSRSDGGGACTPVRNEPALGRDKTADLERRLAALEARLAALEARDPVAGLSDEQSMDRVAVLADRMIRRFFKIVRDMKDDVDSGEL